MKLKLILLASVFALGFAMTATAGTVEDMDTDLVPDVFDNCSTTLNGPGQDSNQVDSDIDGYGNACDADYDNDVLNDVNIFDFGTFLGSFNGSAPDPATDHDGDGDTDIFDFGLFLGQFQTTTFPKIGPSGLACAGTIPCTP